jgi:anti-anti-sigma regulatory factor
MDIGKEASDVETRLVVTGDLTLASVRELREELIAYLTGAGPPSVLDLQGVTDIDAAGLQMLIAAKRSFAERARPLFFRLGDCARQAWRAAGYPRVEEPNG